MTQAEAAQQAPGIAEEDALRAQLYDLLAALLARPADAGLLARCRDLQGDATPLGRAFAELAAQAAACGAKAVSREYDQLFIGLGRGELLPYASYYMTGFLNEKPLALLRADMRKLGIVRAEDVCEPEDHIASLCETMAGLIAGRFGAPASLPAQQDFFARHIAPWARHFFTDLEAAGAARFYAPVGVIGRLFTEIETEAFRMAPASQP